MVLILFAPHVPVFYHYNQDVLCEKVLRCMHSCFLLLIACTIPGVNISGTSSGFVASPNFPNNFDPSKTCVWTITVPSGRIKLSFLNFTLEQGQSTDCKSGPQGGAFVEITSIASNDGDNLFRLCGQNIPDPVYSDANSIQITLTTTSNALPGFNASYETVTDEMCKFLCAFYVFSIVTCTDVQSCILNIDFFKALLNNHLRKFKLVAYKNELW